MSIPEPLRPVLEPVLADVRPLAERFAAAGHRLYLVGGVVRDLLLGQPLPEGADYDLFVFDGQLSEEESNPRVGSNAPEQVRFSARVAGKYYARVVVYKRAASSPNSYLLRAVIQ